MTDVRSPIAIDALRCPACGGPLPGRAARRCAYCAVPLDLALDAATGAGHPLLARARERLRDHPSDAATHRDLADRYLALGLGLADDALRALTVAVGLAPECVGTRLRLATLLADRAAGSEPGAFAPALRHTRRALALAPGSVEGRLLLVRLLTLRGDHAAARTGLDGIAGLPDAERRRRLAWIDLAEAGARLARGDRTGAVAAWSRAAAGAEPEVRVALRAFLARHPRLAETALRRQPRTVRRRALGWRYLADPAPAIDAFAADPTTPLPVLFRLARAVAVEADAAARDRAARWADGLAEALPVAS